MKTKNIIETTGNRRKDMIEVLLEGNDRPCYVKEKNVKGNVYYVPEVKFVKEINENDFSAVVATVKSETEKAILIQGHTGKTMWIPKSVSRVFDGAVEIKNSFRIENNISTIF